MSVQPENVLQSEIRLALGMLPDLVLWRNATGVGEQWDGSKASTLRYGLCIGSSDLIGILSPTGRFVALEVKTATGRVSDDQERFLALVRRMGGYGAVVRSVADALAAVEEARRTT